MTLAADFESSLAALLGAGKVARLGVAVSGGSDSTALLHLGSQWARRSGCVLQAVTVNHGVRAQAQAEAEAVQAQAMALGVSHDILNWTGWTGQGNFQDQARRARYRLIGSWARKNQIEHVALGHTQGDQAETVLMRLLRGSGVDGLSAIPTHRHGDGVHWIRPVLGISRADLRTYLQGLGIGWSDDPSNDDPKYDRVKVRKILEYLDSHGFGAQGLADTAGRMASARAVLERSALDAVKNLAQLRGGAIVIDAAGFLALPGETRRRVMGNILCWIATDIYPPRHSALLGLEAAIANGKTTTLHGCIVTVKNGQAIFGREPAALLEVTAQPSEIWDNRWRLTGPKKPGQSIRMTGDKGLKSCPDWRETGLDRTTVLAAPAVWLGGELIAAPLAGLPNGWSAKLVHSENHFFTTILSH
ncbi:MAG: tRNA lysidine(34) synthetase TilS [Paracoccaceae bacterium]